MQYVLTQDSSVVVSQATPENTEDTKKSTSLASSMLAKLGLAPFFSREKQLVAVVIENHEEARQHQLGLEEALLIEEWMVEGLISRFVLLLDMADLPDTVGPVRSLRPYFIDGTMPWSNVFIHAGGSPEALDKFTGKDMLSINGLRGAYHNLFTRDDSIAAPHNFFITRENILKLPESDRPYARTWPPYETGRAPAGEPATEVDVEFYNPLHNVHYSYKPASQQYVRSNGHVLQHAKPSNVLILEIPIASTGEYGRLHIPVRGEGRLLLFRSGNVYEGTWQKNDLREPFAFFATLEAQEAEPLVFARGQTWLMVVPTLERVDWETTSEIAEEE